MDFFERVFQKNPAIVSRKVGDEYILVPIRDNVGDMENLYTLNEVGAFIWEKIDGKRTVNQIAQLLLNEFEAEETAARNDVKDFFNDLLENSAVF